jgi:hypothetical protein
MVVLDTEVNDPEPAVGGRGEGAAHGREDPGGSEAADGSRSAQRDVHGECRDVGGAAAVRHAGTATWDGFAAGTGAATAPGARVRKRKLDCASHLDWAIIADLLSCVKAEDPMTRHLLPHTTRMVAPTWPRVPLLSRRRGKTISLRGPSGVRQVDLRLIACAEVHPAPHAWQAAPSSIQNGC